MPDQEAFINATRSDAESSLNGLKTYSAKDFCPIRGQDCMQFSDKSEMIHLKRSS